MASDTVGVMGGGSNSSLLLQGCLFAKLFVGPCPTGDPVFSSLAKLPCEG